MTNWQDRFKVGDRVVLTGYVEGWQGQGVGPGGTIWRSARAVEGGGAVEHCHNPDHRMRGWGIRLDNYDYGPDRSNQHTVWDGILEPENNEDELNAAIASIAEAVRNTKEKT